VSDYLTISSCIIS